MILLSGTETRSIYTNGMIRAFGFGIAGVFVPIFLLEQGIPIPVIGLFYATLYSFFLVFALQSRVFEDVFGGIKKLIITGTVLSSIFLATLGKVPVYVSAILAGAGLGFYWVSVNTDFSIHVRKGKAGTALGVWNTVASVPALFAPLLGGWLLNVFGFDLVLMVSAAIVLASALPFVFSEDIFVVPGKRVKDTFISELSAEFMMQGIIFIASVLWPVYIFVSGADLLVVGGLSTLASFALIVFRYFYGKVSDRVSRLFLLKAGALLSAVVWFLALTANDLVMMSIVSILLGFSGAMLGTPLFAFFSEYSKKDPFAWMTIREVSLCAGRVIAALFLFWFSSFNFIFGMAAFASLSLMFAKPVHRD